MQAGTVAPQQAVGNGCVYPAGVKTVADQLEAKGLTWRGYLEDMGTPCRHPAANAVDDTQKAKVGDQYAARHNPFVYFHSITDRASCAANDVDLDRLTTDLASTATTRNLTYITPNLCNDAHDSPCVDGRPGGLATADEWLKAWVPKILASPAYKEDGLLVLTFDEADTGTQSGADACCGEGPGPNSPLPGIYGPGGGRTGTVLLSPFLKAGTINNTRLQPLLAAAHHRGHLRARAARLCRDRSRLRVRRLGGRPMTPPDLTRRRLLTGAAGVAGAVALGTRADAAAGRLPAPGASGIDHIVVLMMENRSFDHYLGWLKGADGKQAGLSYVDRDGVTRRTHHLTDYQGCAHPDPDHSFEGGRVQYNGGRCDGWLRSGENDEFAIGYYTQQDLGFYGHAVPYWTTFDRYFSATLAETYPNRFYQHSARTDRIHNSTATATMPTIWDRLPDKGVSHAYYYVDVPFLALYGTKYLDIARTYPQFLADAAAGTLPAVSFLDPKFLDEGTGSSADDHPHADIRAGQAFVNQVYEAVTGGPGWARTALVVNYDEWGGFYDHVAPSVAPDATPEAGTGMRGFRTPALMVSPRARRGFVSHDVYDHTSVLKMIEWRWGLDALTPRDAAARNMAEVLDFSRAPDLTAPRWQVPPAVSVPCGPASTADYEDWNQLAAKAAELGWRTGGRV